MNQQNFPRYHDPNPIIAQSQSETKYKNMRLILLTMFILSAVNCISLVLMDTFFYLSAYLPFVLIIQGYQYSVAYASYAFYLVFALLALISIVPYLLCYIFSKKKVGWMIAALVMFSLDTLLNLADLLLAPSVLTGVTLAFHVYVLVSLAMGVKYGLDMKKEQAEGATVAPADPYGMYMQTPEAPVDGTAADAYADIRRTITVTRKKSFVGCAIPYAVYVDNRQVAMLKNGQTASFEVSGAAFTLRAGSTNGMLVGHIAVPAGMDHSNYEIATKMGAVTNTLVITQVNA